MTYIVTFDAFRPGPRVDGRPWTGATIEEAPARTGPWTLIDTVTLSPVDADPERPQARTFMTGLATIGAAGWYRVTWTDDIGGQQPVDPIQNLTREYTSLEDMKATLSMDSTSFADADIEGAVRAASRAVDNATGRFFYQDGTDDAPASRYYTPMSRDLLRVDDIVTLTTLASDPGGAGSFATEWTLNQDYTLEPFDAAGRGAPYEIVRLRYGGRYWFSPYYTRSVKAVGVFGWPTVPDEIRQATKILAARLLKRTREAPFGIVTVGVDAAAAMRIGRTDPDVHALIQPYIRSRLFA